MPGVFERLHATAVALGDRCVLIRGPSGSGKSDLALRCIGLGVSPAVPLPVRLVSDDQVIVTRQGDSLVATAPEVLFGKIEVRGVGIVSTSAATSANVVLMANLISEGSIDRLPDPWPRAEMLGLLVPTLNIRPFEQSAALKLITAMTMAELPPIWPKP